MSQAPPTVLARLLRRWRRRRKLTAVLLAAASGLPPAGIAAGLAWLGAGTAALVALAGGLGVSLAVLVWSARAARPGLEEMARHLDRTVPLVEESSELLLRTESELSLVERLQRRRVEAALPAVVGEALLPGHALREAAAWVGLAAAASTAMALSIGVPRAPQAPSGMAPVSRPSPPAAGVEDLEVVVDPPAYTGRTRRVVDQLAVEAEEGARVSWRVRVAPPVDAVRLVLDHDQRLELTASGAGAFQGSLHPTASRLYYLELRASGQSASRSEYARLTVLPDEPPVLEVRQPPPFLELPRAALGSAVRVRVEARDDYGLVDPAMVVTVASGLGEMVEFRERRLPFTRRGSLPAGGELLEGVLEPARLGVAEGDELYFWAEAMDNRRPQAQRARTATHVVRFGAARTPSIGLGAGLPIVHLPALFRSQRQVILDTERLLAEKDSLTDAAWRRRSEAIGFDQRALRLRYGALLGEEFVGGRPAADGTGEADGEQGGQEGSPSTLAELAEEVAPGLAHQHDAAEIATFFDSEVKPVLKASLEEMWGAEGELRSLRPASALPYENRALELLKRAQQRSRLYVKRVGFEAPPLYPDERRLTGDAGGLAPLRPQRRQPVAPPSQTAVVAALDALEPPPGSEVPSPERLAGLLEAVVGIAVERAESEPGVDLDALAELREAAVAARRGELGARQRSRVSALLWSLLPEPRERPVRGSQETSRLFQEYLEHLGSD